MFIVYLITGIFYIKQHTFVQIYFIKMIINLTNYICPHTKTHGEIVMICSASVFTFLEEETCVAVSRLPWTMRINDAVRNVCVLMGEIKLLTRVTWFIDLQMPECLKAISVPRIMASSRVYLKRDGRVFHIPMWNIYLAKKYTKSYKNTCYS